MPINSNNGEEDATEPRIGEEPIALAVTFSTRLKEIRDASERATELAKVINSATKLTEANSILMAQAIFDELMKPADERDGNLLVKFMAAAQKTRDQEIRARALDLAERKINFNASKAVLSVVGKLKEIKDSPEDEQTKIEKVMLLLFGPEPDRFVVPPGKENE